MLKVVFDTNIIIEHLRLTKQKVKTTILKQIISNQNVLPLISTATIQELFAGQSSKKTKEEGRIRQTLKLFLIKNVNEETAELGGKILRDTKTKMNFADAQIAATAILEKASLLTKNKKDFAKIKGVKLYE